MFLPKPLLEPPVKAFDDGSIAEGIAFIQGLLNFARREGRASASVHVHRDAGMRAHRTSGCMEPTRNPAPRAGWESLRLAAGVGEHRRGIAAG